jgi:hypothetical protein
MNSKDNSILEPIFNLYLKKDYSASIEELIKVKDKLDPGLFYYNLGSLQLKTKHLGEARYNLEMARYEGFESAEVFHNLSLLESTLGIDDLSTSKDYFDQTIVFLKFQPTAMYISISLLLIIAALSAKKFLKASRGIYASLLIISCLPLLIKLEIVDRWKVAFAKEKARVFSGPSEVFTDSGELTDGTKLLIGKSSGKWYFVERPRHLSGWINSEELRIIGEKE